MDVLSQFKKNMEELNKAIADAKTQPKTESNGKLFDYKAERAKYSVTVVKNALKKVRDSAWELPVLRGANNANESSILQILSLVNRAEPEGLNITEMDNVADKLSDLALNLKGDGGKASESLPIDMVQLPEAIHNDTIADVNEMSKCFEGGAYRSCIVLCGRVLEAGLHRKYYEATGSDLLATSPGIGLGKIIAKLLEENVKFDPGLTQQIHLINQVRIFSVHSKRDAFYPSKGQAQAMILYTMDVLRKLFG